MDVRKYPSFTEYLLHARAHCRVFMYIILYDNGIAIIL